MVVFFCATGELTRRWGDAAHWRTAVGGAPPPPMMTRRRGGRRGALHCIITGGASPVNGGSRLYGGDGDGGLTGTGAYGGWAYGVPVLTAGDRGGKPRPRYKAPVCVLPCLHAEPGARLRKIAHTDWSAHTEVWRWRS